MTISKSNTLIYNHKLT